MSTADHDPAPAAPAPNATPNASPTATPTRRCENCGAPLLGEHCYACGQPVRGLVRHFSSVAGDFMDTVFNIDSRVLRTLGPLLLRPGWLTLEYFAGRRVRYVTPTRLFLFLSLLAFFAIHARINADDVEVKGGADKPAVSVQVGGIDDATTLAEVEQARKDALAGIDEGLAGIEGAPAAAAGRIALEAARAKVVASADARADWIRRRDDALARGEPAPPAPAPLEQRGASFNFPVDGKPWDPVTNPLEFAWLPDAGNRLLNRRMAHAQQAVKGKDGNRTVVEAMFNVLPQTLIVMMPLFALMLKAAYAFKRRLYMEHLIVALHSHAFIALALTLVMTFAWLMEWLGASPGFLRNLLGWGIGLTSAWIPVYLLLMQKRVYGQGWIMTLLKYGVLGFLYVILLSLALAGAILVGLLTL